MAITKLAHGRQEKKYSHYPAATTADPPECPPRCGLFYAWRKVMTTTDKDRDILACTL